MPIICPVCGGQSQDAEFCDLCNADLAPPTALTVPRRFPLMPKGARLSDQQRQRLGRAESSVVLTGVDGQCWRVHWLPEAEVPRWAPLLKERNRCDSDVLPACRTFEADQGMWVAALDTGRRTQPWRRQRAEETRLELQRVHRFAGLLARTLAGLHEHKVVWLNFDPAELEEVKRPDEPSVLRPTNLDLEVYPAGYYPEWLTVQPAFAAPEICRGMSEHIGPRTDVFHLALFCYYWIARLLPDGFPGAGLDSFGFELPPLRTFAADLPPGLLGVLNLGLTEEPEQRQASPAKFMAEMDQAMADIDKRWAFTGSVAWEIGGHSRTGRAKAAQGASNQDGVLTTEFDEPPRALLAVADGISTCDVGNGTIAASLMLGLLAKAFDADCGKDGFPDLIAEASQKASYDMIDWAVAHGHEPALRDGQSLMGTTLCAGWLQDNLLYLANLGDSRAYLTAGAWIEQLTVDGDMASTMLAAGTPPEQVRQTGSMGKALRDCVGGCQVTDDGELAPWTDAVPSLVCIPLLPGDVLVLCSDGLVEEGAFLDCPTLLALLQEHRELTAADLALLLAKKADALQRLPSPLEPEGFGDNISCIVVKITGRKN